MIYSNKENAQIFVNDSLLSNPATLIIQRHKEPLKVKITTQDTLAYYTLKPKVSPHVFPLNLVFGLATPLAVGADFLNDKRFSHRSPYLLLDHEERGDVSKRRLDDQWKYENKDLVRNLKIRNKELNDSLRMDFRNNRYKGRTVFYFVLPGVYDMRYAMSVGYKNSYSIFSAGFGLDYFYTDNKFINFENAFRLGFDRDDSTDRTMQNYYFTLNNGKRIHRWEYAYGFSLDYLYQDYYYSYWNDWETDGYIEEGFVQLGLSAKVNYQVHRAFYVSASYRPAFAKFSSYYNGFKYGHALGIGFLLKY